MIAGPDVRLPRLGGTTPFRSAATVHARRPTRGSPASRASRAYETGTATPRRSDIAHPASTSRRPGRARHPNSGSAKPPKRLPKRGNLNFHGVTGMIHTRQVGEHTPSDGMPVKPISRQSARCRHVEADERSQPSGMTGRLVRRHCGHRNLPRSRARRCRPRRRRDIGRLPSASPMQPDTGT